MELATLGAAMLSGGCATSTRLPDGTPAKTADVKTVAPVDAKLRGAADVSRPLAVRLKSDDEAHVVTVFQFDKRVWLYDPERGTQVLRQGRLSSQGSASNVAQMIYPGRVDYAMWLNPQQQYD